MTDRTGSEGDRLAMLEAQIAAITRTPLPQPKGGRRFAEELADLQARRLRERQDAAELEAAKAADQEKRMRPQRERRERDLQALRNKMATKEKEHADDLARLGAEYARLMRAPL
jgi:hypothetical protein